MKSEFIILKKKKKGKEKIKFTKWQYNKTQVGGRGGGALDNTQAKRDRQTNKHDRQNNVSLKEV